MPIPDFREDGWLPEGHHQTTWDEIIMKFSGNPNSSRFRVMQGLISWRDKARNKGISGKLILDGGFVSNKLDPKDFDGIFLYDNHVENILAQDFEAKQLLDYTSCKNAGFDLLAFSATAAKKFPKWVHLDAFDRDKITGKPKGVLEVQL